MVMPKYVNGKAVKAGSWTPEEDSLLAEWQAHYGNRWAAVAKKIAGRTGQQCAQRWRHKVNPSIRKEKWTEEEDARLAELAHQFGHSWAEISRRMEGRTDQQCMGRWRRHLDPGIKRDAWKSKEDELLLSLYRKFGSQWSTISKGIAGRTAQQCRARWFQVFQVEGESPPKFQAASKPAVRKARGARSRQMSHHTEEDTSDVGEHSTAALRTTSRQHAGSRGRLRSVAEEQDGDVSLSSDCGEGEWQSGAAGRTPYLTPSKRQSRRAAEKMTRRRDSQLPSGRSSDTVLQSAGQAECRSNIREAQGVSRATLNESSSLGEGEASVTPESRPSSGFRSGNQGSSDLASPPFLSQEPHSMPLESHLLSAAMHYPNCVRSPGQCLLTPIPRLLSELTPQRSGRAGGATARLGTAATPELPLSGKKRGAGGSGHKGAAEEGWKTSPTENVLHLFQSPQPASTRCNLLQSPSFQSLATPEWAKRDWLNDSSLPGAASLERAPPSETRLTHPRGPVARKLDVESALRGRAAPCPAEKPSTMLEEGGDPPVHSQICSPAKKLRSGGASRQELPTPSRLQRGLQAANSRRGARMPGLMPSDGLVHIQTMTEKENSACSALKQLAMGSFAADDAAAQEALNTSGEDEEERDIDSVVTGSLTGSFDAQEDVASVAPEATPAPKTSTQVRMRLHALLENL